MPHELKMAIERVIKLGRIADRDVHRGLHLKDFDAPLSDAITKLCEVYESVKERL